MIDIPSTAPNGSIIQIGDKIFEYTDGKLIATNPKFGGSELSKYTVGVETLTNRRWTDGKPIYVKVIDCGALPNVTTKNVAHGLTGVNVVNFYGVGYSSSQYTSFNATFGGWVIGTIITSTNVSILTNQNFSSYSSSFCVIEYCKVADTAYSPVEVIGNGGFQPHLVTGVETLAGKYRNGKPVYQMEVNFGSLPNTAAKSVAIPGYNSAYNYWINYGDSYAKVTSSSATAGAFYCHQGDNSGTSNLYTWTFIIINGNISVTTSSDRTGYDTVRIVLNYTK